jgi:hypothetical protein
VSVIGYGVLADGKPSGLWPVTLGFARRTANSLTQRAPSKRVEIVEVHTGKTVPLTEPTFTEASTA